jgi:hypothetical protein
LARSDQVKHLVNGDLGAIGKLQQLRMPRNSRQLIQPLAAAEIRSDGHALNRASA